MSWSLTRLVAVATLSTVPLLSSCGLNWIVRPPWTRPSDKDDVVRWKLEDHISRTKPAKGVVGAVWTGGWDSRDNIPTLDIHRIWRLRDQELLLDEVRKWKDTSRFDEVIVKFYGPEDDALVERIIRTERVKLQKEE